MGVSGFKVKAVVQAGSEDPGNELERGALGIRKQRWAREAYNAYQRNYMRKRRAVQIR